MNTAYKSPTRAFTLCLTVITPLALHGCSEPVDIAQYKGVPDCVIDGNPQPECQRAYDIAMERAKEVAPRYQSVADCEEDFGKGKCGRELEKVSEADVTEVCKSGTKENSDGECVRDDRNPHAMFYPYFYPYPYGYAYTPSMGFGGTTTAEPTSRLRPQPVFRRASGETVLSSGSSVQAGRSTTTVGKTSIPSQPARFTSGATLSKGASLSSARTTPSFSAPKPVSIAPTVRAPVSVRAGGFGG